MVFRLATQSGIGPAAANIREAANVTEDLAELIGFLPGDGEGADAARRDSANRAVLGVLRDIQPFQRHGQKLIDQGIGIAVAERIVFERPIAAVLAAGL